MSRRFKDRIVFFTVVLAAFACVSPLLAQHTTALQPDASAPNRTRLFLKDGSYQIVMSYRIVGNVVHYVSAERGGAEEEIPLSLVDLDATQRWEKQHAQPLEGDNPHPPAIDPELLKEEADRAALTPEVAKDLRLPEEDSTLVLDTFHGTPELVPLSQPDSDLNRDTGHNLLKGFGQSALCRTCDRAAQRGDVARAASHQGSRSLSSDWRRECGKHCRAGADGRYAWRDQPNEE